MRKAALLLVCVLTPSQAPAGDIVTGEATVRDAITIVISGGRFRLDGIAAAKNSKCGEAACNEAARAQLAKWVNGQQTSCEKIRKLGHGFFLASCRLADGSDPAALLVAKGLVLADPAGAVYAAEAAKAESDRKGLWQK